MDSHNQRNSTLVFGVILIAVGALFLLGQVLNFSQWGSLWPLATVGVGALFFLGMLLGGKSTGALAIPGAIFTGLGLILLFQNLTGAWETWSYAWGLIVASVGVGIYIFGLYSDRPGAREAGMNVTRVGLTLFLVFGIIFEVIFTVTGVSTSSGSLFFPIALVVVGFFMLISRSVRIIRGAEKVKGEDRDLFWPIMFIGGGFLWILVIQGYISANQLSSLIGLWPVLLIVLGVELMFGRRYPWVSALMGVLVVGCMFFVTFNSEKINLPKGMSWPAVQFILPGNTSGSGIPLSGSGNVVSETRPVGSFSRIDFASVGDVEISQGANESLTVEAEDNIMPYLITEVRGDWLVIRLKSGVGNLRPIHTIRYKIVVKDLKELKLSGAGKITVQELTTDDLTIDASGAGGVTVKDLQGKSLDTGISGAGSVTVDGNVDQVKVDISGTGSYNGGDLKSQDASVSISGLGSATVWATDQLKVNISGAGSVNYYGSPTVTKRTTGLGSVHSLGEK
jgi:hypothetical protein